MYLTLGKNTVVREENIVGIFDLDSSSQSYITREYLSAAEKRGTVTNAAEDIPNSFLIVSEKKEETVYLTQNMSKTLAKRIEQTQKERRNTWRKSMI